MSDGIKNMYDDEENELYKLQLKKIKSKRPEEILKTMDTITDCIKRIDNSNPSFTRSQWAFFKEIEEELKKFWKDNEVCEICHKSTDFPIRSRQDGKTRCPKCHDNFIGCKQEVI